GVASTGYSPLPGGRTGDGSPALFCPGYDAARRRRSGGVCPERGCGMMRAMAVLVRLLFRIAAFGLVGALARRTPAPPYRTPGQQPPTHGPADRVRQLRGVVEGAGMVVRLLTIMALLAASGTL